MFIAFAIQVENFLHLELLGLYVWIDNLEFIISYAAVRNLGNEVRTGLQILNEVLSISCIAKDTIMSIKSIKREFRHSVLGSYILRT